MGLSRALALLIFAIFLGFPLLAVGLRANATLAAEYFPVLRSASAQASFSTLISIGVGIPLGIFYAANWNRWTGALATLAFSLPSIFVVAFMQSALSATEYRVGLPAVVLAHVFLNAPWIALATAEGIASVPKEWVHAARTLGADRMRVFRSMILPVAAKRIAIASAQVFALCLGSFAIVLILGGGPPVTSLEAEIYASVRGGSLALGNAAHYAIAQLVIASFPLALILALGRGGAARDTLAGRSPDERPSGLRALLGAGVAGAWVAVPAWFFARHLDWSSALALLDSVELRSALEVSARIALWVALFVIGVGAFIARIAKESRMVRALSTIPLGVSPLVLSLGFFLAYANWIDPFEGSELAMIAVQGMLFLPFALRFFLPIVAEESSGPRRNLRDVARTLGATHLQAWWKLEWPRWRSASLRLAGLVFVWSISEVAASSFFGSERLVTLGRLLMVWHAQYRFAEASLVMFGMYLGSLVILVWAERPRT